MRKMIKRLIDKINLKSNMDRFIDSNKKCTIECMRHLKSNMDRFIVNALPTTYH